MSISLGTVFEPFVEQRPICVMARGVLEHLFHAERIDALCGQGERRHLLGEGECAYCDPTG